MADETTKPAVKPATKPVAEDAPKSTLEETVGLPGIAAPANATIGDENIPAPEPFEFQVNDTPVKAQVTGPPAEAVSEVYVHESFVQTDKVITDPSDPLAVQIPDAGRGSLDLPIHQLTRERPEDFFAREASKSSD